MVLQHELMLLFCVGIVHTNLYNCISAIILYFELFDTASHACGLRQEGHPVETCCSNTLY